MTRSRLRHHCGSVAALLAAALNLAATPLNRVDDAAGTWEGTVNLIGSGRDKARGETGHTKAYARTATPVTSAQVWKGLNRTGFSGGS